MTPQEHPPGLARIDSALAVGDVVELRRALAELGPEELNLLRAEMGAEGLERAQRAARSPTRARKMGRVVVVHGIMGSLLDSIDEGGDADRVWINMFRLVAGRFADLELGLDGEPAGKGRPVRTAGLYRKTYMPLVLELGRRWHVRPFAFDWREAVDRSARRLAGEISAWSNGEPVHVVAHSMGGLVTRRMSQLDPDRWTAMDNPGRRAGGRLVMLGTPNRGAYIIPLLLVGQERMMKMLATADLRHDSRELLDIVATFQGIYDMMPSPEAAVDDDHRRLYEAATWGDMPVRPGLLARAAEFQTALNAEVRDPDRLTYVAGYNRPTPFKVRVDGPGRLSFQRTLAGDGRVPHALGLLDGVRTLWVDEGHGDLPSNGSVLEGIHDLLLEGSTGALPSARPAGRGAADDGTWIPAALVDPVDRADSGALGRAARSTSDGGPQPLATEEALRLGAILASDYTGAIRQAGSVAGTPPPEVKVEVVWGSITRVKGDVFAVGHYRDVPPVGAELALDRAVSGGVEPLVITEQTRRGLIGGRLGEISFVPWNDSTHEGAVVVVAGMGSPGTFDADGLRRLVRNMAWAVASLPGTPTLCSVLIGSGEGTLSIREAVRGLLWGLADGLGQEGRQDLATVKIVEIYRNRARRIHAELATESQDPLLAGRLKVSLSRSVTRGPGHDISSEDGLALALGAMVSAASAPGRSSAGRAVDALLETVPLNAELRARVRDRLKDAGDPAGGIEEAAGRLRVAKVAGEPSAAGFPTRISVVHDGVAIRAAAITETATVAERIIRVDFRLVEELVRDATKATQSPEEADELSVFMTRLLMPAEFRRLLLGDRGLVIEVDRTMAQVHWEMLCTDPIDGAADPVAVRRPVARQLRTTYSPGPASPASRSGRLRALVVGDPGDPEKGHDLPGARREAMAVWGLLAAADVDVVAMIGVPGTEPAGAMPARRIRVLQMLASGELDLVHYAGHGAFDPDAPDERAGWLFAGGLLSARELETIDRAPSLVVANACLSVLTSQVPREGAPTPVRSEAALLPGLADEFFRRGVRDYVGTAWEVDDEGAVLFATEFYQALLPPPTGLGMPLGNALLRARQALRAQSDLGSLWAAYQHYGDPSARLAPQGAS